MRVLKDGREVRVNTQLADWRGEWFTFKGLVPGTTSLLSVVHQTVTGTQRRPVDDFPGVVVRG